MPPAGRPQTLKQAKRAYRKSNTPNKLSASELAIIERRALLQERADRIKEREARRKANLKKREEKIAKERETAKRMGIPFREEGEKKIAKIGASQLDLGSFLGCTREPKARIDPSEESILAEKAALVIKPEGSDPQQRPSPRPQTQSGKSEAQPLGQSCQQSQHDKVSEKEKTANMGPPARPPLRSLSSNTSLTMKTSLPTKQTATFRTTDVGLEDFFVSNTQVERELSPSEQMITGQKPVIPVKPDASLALQKTLVQPEAHIWQNESADDLLACLSTQDLDLPCLLTQVVSIPIEREVEDPTTVNHEPDSNRGATTSKSPLVEAEVMLAQISTQDVDFSDDPDIIPAEKPKPRPETRTDSLSFLEYAEEVADDDLEDLALELDLASSREAE